MMRLVLLGACGLVLSGCSTANLGDRLGTMKNPDPVLESPADRPRLSHKFPLMEANYGVLLQAVEATGSVTESSNSQSKKEPARMKIRLVAYDPKNKKPVEMRKYLNAGFALSDLYCEEFFKDAQESQSRRKYGRAITNDVGTAMTTILGLANAGQDLVTGVAAGFGFGDSVWRNYDEAFVVSPDLANVRELVLSANDVFRKRTYASDLPQDYGAAQSTILRYANQCSTLGMKSLLNQSANQQQQALKKEASPEVEEKGGEDDTSDTVNEGDAAASTAAPIAIPS